MREQHVKRGHVVLGNISVCVCVLSFYAYENLLKGN